MRKLTIVMALVSLVGLLVAQTFDLAKTREEIKTTDLIVVVRVPVIEDGTLRPNIPKVIRELRKTDIVLYDTDDIDTAQSAIVVMVVPAENIGEMNKRLAEHPSIEVMTEPEVRALRDIFSQSERALDHLKDRVRFALTPYDEAEAFK